MALAQYSDWPALNVPSTVAQRVAAAASSETLHGRCGSNPRNRANSASSHRPRTAAGSHSTMCGIGISNTKRRLDLFYEDRYTLEIDDKANEFSVHLKIPV